VLIYQGTRGESRFFGLPPKGHYKIEDASLHAPHASTARMHFSSSLLSSAILVLGYLANAALCVSTNEPSKLAVNNNQQPFQSTGNCERLRSLRGTFIPWMREGLDPNVNYGVVSDPRPSMGEGPFY
jgi:hypothetical protein